MDGGTVWIIVNYCRRMERVDTDIHPEERKRREVSVPSDEQIVCISDLCMLRQIGITACRILKLRAPYRRKKPPGKRAVLLIRLCVGYFVIS